VLVVTVSTVEYHLASAYRKLGIASRHALPAALQASSDAAGADRVAARASDG
jgi:DNA-binding NarL/FixJ family response regulator